MTYSLHIHRRTDWSECGDDITLAEWQTLCEADPTLELTGIATARNPRTGEVIEIRAEGLARWDGPVTAWFTLERGRITVGGADDAIIDKALAIAWQLGAQVQGDEGEFYGPDDVKG
jgi:hypothetical protein